MRFLRPHHDAGNQSDPSGLLGHADIRHLKVSILYTLLEVPPSIYRHYKVFFGYEEMMLFAILMRAVVLSRHFVVSTPDIVSTVIARPASFSQIFMAVIDSNEYSSKFAACFPTTITSISSQGNPLSWPR